MPGPIAPISGAAGLESIRPAGVSGAKGAFQDALASAINNVEGMRQGAAASVERFLAGEGEELHTAIMATQRSELAFEIFLQARNKVVNAYQEIMRMQV